MNRLQEEKDSLQEFNTLSQVPGKVRLFVILIFSLLALYVIPMVIEIIDQKAYLSLFIDARFAILIIIGFVYPIIGIYLFHKRRLAGWFILTHYCLLHIFLQYVRIEQYIDFSSNYSDWFLIIIILQSLFVIGSILLSFNKAVLGYFKVSRATIFYVIFLSFISPLLLGLLVMLY